MGLIVSFFSCPLKVLNRRFLVLVDSYSVIVEECHSISHIWSVEFCLFFHDIDQFFDMLDIHDLIISINQFCRIRVEIHVHIDVLAQGLIILNQIGLQKRVIHHWLRKEQVRVELQTALELLETEELAVLEGRNPVCHLFDLLLDRFLDTGQVRDLEV